MSSLTLENGNLVLQTPYDRALVLAIKTLPTSDRLYDPKRKVWYIHPKQGKTVKQWVEDFLGENITLPVIKQVDAKPVMQIFEVRYIGTTKNRDDGTSSAFGLVGKDWKLIFPEVVLRAWFDAGQAVPGTQESLYSILGTNQQATIEEIKTAYRRMVRQWHPDVCREANAQEVFIRIQSAYETLSNPIQRAKYNAGLKLQASMSPSTQKGMFDCLQNGYRSPLRCGYLMVEGVEKIGRFVVEKILGWEDIVNSAGQVLVTSWALGAKEPTEVWN
jgi:hypothetical protein